MQDIPRTQDGSPIGMPWYGAANYGAFRAAMEDAEHMPEDHATWQHQALLGERQLLREGCKVVRVDMELERFREFCRQQGLPLSSVARLRYVQAAAQRLWGGH